MRLAALDHLAAIRVERIVDDPLHRIKFVVVLEAEMREAFDRFRDRVFSNGADASRPICARARPACQCAERPLPEL